MTKKEENIDRLRKYPTPNLQSMYERYKITLTDETADDNNSILDDIEQVLFERQALHMHDVPPT